MPWFHLMSTAVRIHSSLNNSRQYPLKGSSAESPFETLFFPGVTFQYYILGLGHPVFEISSVQERDVKTPNVGQFDPDRLAEIGQKYQKAHIQVDSFT